MILNLFVEEALQPLLFQNALEKRRLGHVRCLEGWLIVVAFF